ncbi:hypothetical protein OKW41_001302 [Paraburkholderia sp. UCT70]
MIIRFKSMTLTGRRIQYSQRGAADLRCCFGKSKAGERNAATMSPDPPTCWTQRVVEPAASAT